MKTSVVQIFEYLLAVKNLTVPVIRDIQGYNDQYWWQAEFPVGEGCYLQGTGSNPEAWLEVRKQVIPPPPPPPPLLKEWLINEGTEPDKPPRYHDTLCKLSWAESKELEELPNRIETLEQEKAMAQVEAHRAGDGDSPDVRELTARRLEEALQQARARRQSLADRRHISFDADPQRPILWDRWMNEAWQPWAETVGHRVRVQRLYGALFALHQRLQREGESLEFVWGHGLLTWHRHDLRVRRPVLTTRVELLFDAHKGVFTLIPTETGTLLELDMLTGMDLPNATHLLQMERVIEEAGLDPWDRAIAHPFLQEVAHSLDPKGEAHLSGCVSGQGVAIETYPILYDAPVLFIRSHSGRQWQQDLKTIIKALREDYPVPETLTSLATEALPQPDERVRQEWQPVGEDLLFPLPTNEEQREIVRRLARNFGVAVQGPPGTGKSHTIVNLLAHLLAHGKRVLVTSQTERALRVLGDMLRNRLPEIAPLCVSVLGGDSRSTKELDEAITKISDRLASLDPDSLALKVQQLRKELHACKDEIARLKTDLRRAAEAEHHKILIGGREMSPLEVAEWLTENQTAHGWFPDPLSPEAQPPLTEAEVVRLHRRIGILSKSDCGQLAQKRPPLEKLPTAAVLGQHFDRLKRYEEEAPLRDERLRGWTFPSESPSHIPQATERVDKAYAGLETLMSDWMPPVIQDIVRGGPHAQLWAILVKESRERIKRIRAVEQELVEFSIQAPKTMDLIKIKEDLQLLREELAKGKGLGFLFRQFRGKHTRYVLEEYKLNGAAPRSAEDINRLMRYVENQEAKGRLFARWNNSVQEIGGPSLDAARARWLQSLEEHVDRIEAALHWEANDLRPLQQVVNGIAPPGQPAWSDLPWLKRFKEGIWAYADKVAEQAERQFSAQLAQFLKEGLSDHQAHPAWGRLLSALERRDVQGWAAELEELQGLAALEPWAQDLHQLRERLAAAAPRWLAEIERQGGGGKPLPPPADWRTAWEWRRAESWLQQHLHRIRAEELHEKLRAARAKESHLTEDLVASTTWLEQLQHITHAQKRSLLAWLQTIRKIGKGTGKYAAKHMADAKREMVTCRGAIPVWIMPLHRVIENLKPTGDPFDVVIVDESSQCDLFALSALFRARRAVIVGDDKQISPENVGWDQSEIHALIERHLIGIPQRERFTLQDSLYDVALRIFPGQLMLKEHFRCVPEIIQFSNDMFYGGSIEPLRMPPSENRLTPAIMAVRVPEGRRDEGARDSNEPEAHALVAKVVELCNRPEYRNKTMGVISLLGREQAQLIEQLLRERLGERELVDRRLICGDAYAFQGDERDVIFLSMVAADNLRHAVLNRAPHRQRFNVAASRARDQMWLFHSIDLNELNPECMRYQLLNYCLNPQRTRYEMEKAEAIFNRYGSSRFHKEVYKQIVARGYRAIPEFKVGTHPYRIDIAIEGIHARLAVECDGDQWHGMDRWEADRERQMVLERVGWRFWRVRGSVFYRDRQKALEPLWSLLEEMGIHPSST